MFKLAHLSDVHLSPLPRVRPVQLLNKRVIGILSWKLRRKSIHDNAVLEALKSDIAAKGVDHVALTGDLINISLPGEFDNARQWLNDFGAPDWISLVPGNHDSYVRVPWQSGLTKWADYMTGDLVMPGFRSEETNEACFPYVRRRRNVAIIGVSSAVPAPWNKASGTVGTRQLEALETILKTLNEKGFYRVVMVHHPPLPGLTLDRKALTDATEMMAVLERQGAELVLHGHNHKHMRSVLETHTGPAHVIGVPSASAKKTPKKPSAAWYEYGIRRTNGSWTTKVTIHQYDADADAMAVQSSFDLEHN